MLYHYTSLHGLLGILLSESLWATDVKFLNDANEFEHALSFAKHATSELLMDQDYYEQFAFDVRDALENLRPKNLFITSFSEKPDLLSQWRGYCPVGAGICIGFDKTIISEFCNLRGYSLKKCSYEETDHVKQVLSLIDQCERGYPRNAITLNDFEKLGIPEKLDAMQAYRELISHEPNSTKVKSAIDLFCSDISELAPTFKDNGFHEEAEWRLIAKNPSEQVKFRVNSNSTYLIPFVELNIMKEFSMTAIKEIIVGPNANQARTIASLRHLLKEKEMTFVNLKSSSIPYNNW
jgi:hypothetical protein